MEVVPLGSADEIAAVAAEVIESVRRRKPAARDPAAPLGLATGAPPLPAYQERTRRHEAGTGPSYAAVTCFNLDEYVGLPAAAGRAADGAVPEQRHRGPLSPG